MHLSRQEQIDRAMCKPGYQWNETLGRCIGGAASAPDNIGNKPSKPTPDDAIQQEIASRQTTGEV